MYRRMLENPPSFSLPLATYIAHTFTTLDASLFSYFPSKKAHNTHTHVHTQTRSTHSDASLQNYTHTGA